MIPEVQECQPTTATTCNAGMCDEAESETEVNGGYGERREGRRASWVCPVLVVQALLSAAASAPLLHRGASSSTCCERPWRLCLTLPSHPIASAPAVQDLRLAAPSRRGAGPAHRAPAAAAPQSATAAPRRAAPRRAARANGLRGAAGGAPQLPRRVRRRPQQRRRRRQQRGLRVQQWMKGLKVTRGMPRCQDPHRARTSSSSRSSKSSSGGGMCVRPLRRQPHLDPYGTRATRQSVLRALRPSLQLPRPRPAGGLHQGSSVAAAAAVAMVATAQGRPTQQQQQQQQQQLAAAWGRRRRAPFGMGRGRRATGQRWPGRSAGARQAAQLHPKTRRRRRARGRALPR
jgi:hypothetical protein